MSQYDLTSRYKWVTVTYISWFSDFTLVSGNYIIYLCNQSVIMKKNCYICFLSIYFYLIFFLVYIILILLLTCDKGDRLIFYIYSIYIKIWCKKFAFRMCWHEPGVYLSPCSLAVLPIFLLWKISNVVDQSGCKFGTYFFINNVCWSLNLVCYNCLAA